VGQSREAVLIQAIGRLRLIHVKKPRRSTSCANIPLDIPVDELVMWKQLIGDRRLNDALAERDERGWDALPLVAKEMPRLFPIFGQRRNPPNAGTRRTPQSHIRYNLEFAHRPPGQTSWPGAARGRWGRRWRERWGWASGTFG
jgi:hypothetical protein